jgi:hypothetical protein
VIELRPAFAGGTISASRGSNHSKITDISPSSLRLTNPNGSQHI